MRVCKIVKRRVYVNVFCYLRICKTNMQDQITLEASEPEGGLRNLVSLINFCNSYHALHVFVAFIIRSCFEK